MLQRDYGVRCWGQTEVTQCTGQPEQPYTAMLGPVFSLARWHHRNNNHQWLNLALYWFGMIPYSIISEIPFEIKDLYLWTSKCTKKTAAYWHPIRALNLIQSITKTMKIMKYFTIQCSGHKFFGSAPLMFLTININFHEFIFHTGYLLKRWCSRQLLHAMLPQQNGKQKLA